MVERIGFSVLKVSGEDENFPSAELMDQRPTAKGWQSPKFSSFPQILIIQLAERARISRFQVLSHAYLITKKLELHVGDVKNNLPDALQNVSWEKQGEISFSENSASNFEARELRSAFLDVVAKYVKLILHQNHDNKLNLHNQVGIVAVNILGEIILAEDSKQETRVSEDHILNLRSMKPSMMDELAFNTYVDVEIAEMIRVLDKRKHKAILVDRFVYAKKLKYAISELKRVGEKIGKLDIEKAKAIEKEDFDQAHIKANEIENIRRSTYDRLHVQILMEMNEHDIRVNNEESNDDIVPSRLPSEFLVPMSGNYVNIDDIIVPALKRSVKTQPSVYPQSDVEFQNDYSVGKMTEKEKRKASLPIDIFGLPVVEKMFSKSFNNREEAMKDIGTFMKKYQRKGRIHPPSDVIRAATFLIQKALCDKVISVYVSALTVLRSCFQYFIPTHRVSKTEVMYMVEETIPEIANKLGETTSRLKSTSMEYLISIAMESEIQKLQIIPQYSFSPLKNILNVRLALGRCELVEQLVKKYPPWEHNIVTLPRVMQFLLDALQHPNNAVRAVAERIIFFLYEKESSKVRKYLSLDTNFSKRNIMYRRLFHEFQKIDEQGFLPLKLKKSDKNERLRVKAYHFPNALN